MIALVMVVRDEDDVLGPMLSYHLSSGIDHVIVTDHRSVDGTTEILRGYQRDGVLTYVRDDRPTISQGAATTTMARFAALELGAAWVLPADADELWWSREGPLRDVLSAVPRRYSVIHGVWRHFVLRPDDDRPFFERMTLRCRPSRDLDSVYQRQVKVLFRAAADVVVEDGNHGLTCAPPGQTLRGWYPLEVLHFPFRSRAQLERKLGGRQTGFEAVARHQRAAQAHPGGLVDFAATVCPVGVELKAGLDRGELVPDVRARDVLRALADGLVPQPRLPSLEEDVDFAQDVELALERDSAARLGARLRVADGRARALEKRRRAAVGVHGAGDRR